MGETMNRKWGILVAMGMVAAMGMTCDETDVPTPVPTPVLDEPTVDERKVSALAVGEWVVTRTDNGYNGRVGIFVGLDIQLVTVRTGSHYRMDETLNLCLRERDAGSDDWVTVQTLNVGAGDYIIVNTDTTGVNSVSAR